MSTHDSKPPVEGAPFVYYCDKADKTVTVEAGWRWCPFCAAPLTLDPLEAAVLLMAVASAVVGKLATPEQRVAWGLLS